MRSRIYATPMSAIVLAMAFTAPPQVGAQDRHPPKPRLVWAANPVPPTAYESPNRLIWPLSEILAAHKGQASWRLPVVKTRDFEADWISMAPGEKTKTVFYADDRVFWVVESGKMRVNIEGQAPFVATKGFLVQAAPRLAYSMETVGDEPVLRFEVRPAGEMPSYPIDETPAPVKGWTFIKSRITDTGSYDQYNKPYLDFLKDVVEANAGSSNFVWDGHTAAHIIRGKGIPTPPDTNLGHFHENMVELWIVLEGQLDFLIEGEPLVTGTVGDVIQAPNERWHRATSRAPGMATRLAITPRNKEGQVHYWQPEGQGDAQ
jgi:mannose-6-phosphate isomerase-like protein (cupin superfamily)